MNIIIMGPQASGKGTQAKIISEKLNIPHISTGDIFRENINKNTGLGVQIENLINTGAMVSDDIANAIIKERLERDDAKNGFILDGYPRDVAQAEFLSVVSEIDKVIELSITDEEAIKRIGNRKVCVNCGAVYHPISGSPKQKNECDKCDGVLITRDDDKEEAIITRLRLYHELTEKLTGYYKERGVYIKIDGMPSIDKVSEEILKNTSYARGALIPHLLNS